jgi:glycine cleavage system H protein
MAYTTPAELLYAASHEWVLYEDDEVTVGISDYAQHALGDVVFVDLPEVGRTLEKSETFGAVESVKAASDVYAPVSGEIVAVNEALLDAPETVNSDPYGAGWMIKLRASAWEADRSDLLEASTYEQLAAEEESQH